MRLPSETYHVQQTIETHLPHLSQSQLTGLALWVCGAILAGSACRNAVASALSPWGRWNRLRQYLREWLYDGSDRTSPCRTQLDATLCFAPLLRWALSRWVLSRWVLSRWVLSRWVLSRWVLSRWVLSRWVLSRWVLSRWVLSRWVLSRWVLSWWRSDRLALAIDPTLKGDQTAAIVISVVYRSCAIPVAPYPVRGRLWSIRRANREGSPYPVRGRLWMDPTVELLRELAPAVPRDKTVIVLCDRGISSPKLWKQIRAQGWRPGMRYRNNITFCADGGKRLPALAFVPVPDTAWIGRGTAFGPPTAQRRCTLLAVWYAEQEEPWIILTDLAPDKVGPSWYALRFWPRIKYGVTLSRWASRPSRAWAGSGTRPGERTLPASPATGWRCRWRRCWPPYPVPDRGM